MGSASHTLISNHMRKKLEIVDDFKSRNPLDNRQLLFLSKLFVLANLPHRDTSPDIPWVKKNGHFVLHIAAGERIVNGQIQRIGVPFGSYARLILIWLTTQAVQRKSRVIELSDSLSAFMRDMGIKPTGGLTGSIRAIKEQFIRICSCKVIIEAQNYETELIGTQFYLVEEKHVRWLREAGGERLSERGEIVLSEKFYDNIAGKSVPFDCEVVSAIKQSSLALDIYIWLTYRLFYLNNPIILSWQQLQDQMGSQYTDIKNFRTKFLHALRDIKIFYPELKADIVRGGLKLSPSPLTIKQAA